MNHETKQEVDGGLQTDYFITDCHQQLSVWSHNNIDLKFLKMYQQLLSKTLYLYRKSVYPLFSLA